MFLHNFVFQTSLIREVKHDVYGKRQTVGRCMSQKHENLRFSACLTLLRSFSIYLGNRQERSLKKSSFSVFWQKENFILPFAVNVMLNLPVDSRLTTHDSFDSLILYTHCWWWLAFRQPVQKLSSESSDSFSHLEIQKPWWAIWWVNR